jgi:hypothetical protein
MPLTAAQKRKLPPSAFVYPKQRRYPVPTKAQAKAAGISEASRLRTHRNALSRAAQKTTMGSVKTVRAKVNKRSNVGKKGRR